MGRGRNRGGIEGLKLSGAEGAPQLFLEVRQATGWGGPQWESVAATNCVGAARVQIICVGSLY